MILFITTNFTCYNIKQLHIVNNKGWKKWSKLTNLFKRTIILKYE